MNAPLRGFSLTSFDLWSILGPAKTYYLIYDSHGHYLLATKWTSRFFDTIHCVHRHPHRHAASPRARHAHNYTRAHRRAYACSFIDFAGVKGESGRQWIQRPPWYIEVGQKRALSCRGAQRTEDFCLRSLITVLTQRARQGAHGWLDGLWPGRENYWKIDFFFFCFTIRIWLPFDQGRIDAWAHLARIVALLARDTSAQRGKSDSRVKEWSKM